MFAIDRYVVDTLMPDLVGHDRVPSGFLVYLYLTAAVDADGGPTVRSLRAIAEGTGLSIRAVQEAIRHLTRRRLIGARRQRPTDVATWNVNRPWHRRRT